MWITLKQAHFGKPAGERLEIDDKSAQTLIAGGIAEAYDAAAIGQTIDRQFAASMDAFQKSLDERITATLKALAQAQTRSNKNAVPLIFGAQGEGDKNHNFGDWCLAVATKNTKRLVEHYGSQWVDYKGTPWGDQMAQKAAMGEASGVTGGYTVPPDFYQQLLTIVQEKNFIRPYAFVQPMASATLQFPYLDITTAQAAGITPFFGGVQMTWTEEAQTRTETEPQFKMMELKAHELSGYSVSSNVLLQDAAFGLEKFLFMLFGGAIAWFEEYAFLQGNGVGKPMGMLNAGAALSTTRANANLVKFADVATMWSKLLPASWKSAIWAFSPSVVPQLLQLQDGANRAIFISIDQGVTKTPNWSLLGRPAFPTEKLPALGTSGDIMLIDPALYVIGDRMQIEIAASEHVNFLKNQMTWRVVERVDGQPWIEKAITLQDGATQVSPFVYLHN